MKYGEAVVGTRYAALVKGSSAIFPRGFPWLIPVLWTMRTNAFVADESGIRLGLRGAARRRLGRRRRDNALLPWPDVQQLKIASRPYGARLDILLHRDSVVDRRNPVWLTVATVLTVLIPVVYVFRSPGLLRPRSYNPPRYRIKLLDVRPGELRLALAPLAPPTVAIAVRRTWRARALGLLRRSRLAPAT